MQTDEIKVRSLPRGEIFDSMNIFTNYRNKYFASIDKFNAPHWFDWREMSNN